MGTDFELGFERLTKLIALLDVPVVADDGPGLRGHLLDEFDKLTPIAMAAETINRQDFCLDRDADRLPFAAYRNLSETLLHSSSERSFCLISYETE